MKLEGRVAIVTGGAGGLGLGLSEALLKRGCKVCIFDYNIERGKEAEKTFQTKFGEDRVRFQFCNVMEEKSFTDAFQTAISQHGNVDVMVNNAAICDEKKDIDKVILTNLGGTIRGTNLAVKHMRKDEGGKGGVIINICSIAGVTPYMAVPVYVSTKHGVCGFTRSWAENPYLKELGLRFGQLCPWAFESSLCHDPENQFLYPKEHMEPIMDVGYLKVEEVAAGLIELLEDDDSNGAMLFSHPEDGFHRKKIQVVNE